MHNLIGQEWEGSQRTRQLNVENFFCYSQYKKGEVKVVFCPTHDMLGVYQATTREIIHINEGKDTKSAKCHMYHHAQECVG